MRNSYPGRVTFEPPVIGVPNKDVVVQLDPNSSRLQLLQPFKTWNGKELTDQLVLIRIRGQCTTEHIRFDLNSIVFAFCLM
jgi:aconitase A